MMFSGIYTHVLLSRQVLLQQEVNYLLEVATQARYGYMSSALISESKSRLASHGLEDGKLIYLISSTSGQSAVDASHPIPRGEGIILKISYPFDGLLDINQLVGIKPPSSEARINGFGQRMSEYIAVHEG
ncbi:MAG: hypothetical protein RLZZ267_309 [Bacillota bacterium]|jgi:hypothetical protein